MKKRSGFTIVEVAIVIVVIAILASLTLVVFGRTQAESRDRTREVDVNQIANALENYYDTYGEYPSCAQMTANGSTVVSNTLKQLPPQALTSPKADSYTTNSVRCGDSNLNTSDIYAYVGDGSTACSGSLTCRSWELKYKKESNGDIVSIKSNRVADALILPTVTVKADECAMDSIKVTWTTLSGATYYLVQVSDSSDFSTIKKSGTYSPSVTSAIFSGLNFRTTYYVRVFPNLSASSLSDWSQTVRINIVMTGGSICNAI